MFHLFIFLNFVQSELLSIKIKEFKSNIIIIWILIGVQFSATCSSKFIIFVACELLGAKTKESKSIKLYIYIYIYNEKPLHILEMHKLKKV